MVLRNAVWIMMGCTARFWVVCADPAAREMCSWMETFKKIRGCRRPGSATLTDGLQRCTHLWRCTTARRRGAFLFLSSLCSRSNSCSLGL